MYKRLDSNYEVSSEGEVRNIKTWCTQSYNLSYGNKSRKELLTKRVLGSINAPKPVIQMTKDRKIIAVFEAASRSTGIASTHISDCCNKKICKDSKGYMFTTKSAGGYVWEFQESNH